MVVVGFLFVIESDEYVLRFQSSHDASEKTGFAAAIPTQHACDPAGLCRHEGTLEDRLMIEFQMDTIYKKLVIWWHGKEQLLLS